MTAARSKNGKKSRRYQVVVHNSDDLEFQYVIESLQMILGYEQTQAATCAYLIDSKGKYVVKAFAEKEHAVATVDTLLEYEFDAEMIDTFS